MTQLKQFHSFVYLFVTISLVTIFWDCNRNPYITKIKEAIEANDYLTVAGICSEYKFEEFKQECESSLIQAEADIEEIISKKQELPFMKFILPPEKSQKIQNLLRANIELGIKYRSIWNETAEVYKE